MIPRNRGPLRYTAVKLLIFFTILFLAPFAQAEICILDQTQDSKESYIWTVSSEQLEHLPAWKKGENPPLSLADAEKLALEWTRKQPLAGEIPDRPFSILLTRLPGPYQEHFYYKINYGSAEGKINFWTVCILMDGTLIAPIMKK